MSENKNKILGLNRNRKSRSPPLKKEEPMVVGMETEILEEMQERIVKSFLDVLILAQLKIESKSAYEIIAFVHKRFCVLLSAGTVYATLYSLERNGLVEGDFTSGKSRARVYKLTRKGQKSVRTFLKVNEKIQMFLADLLGGSSE